MKDIINKIKTQISNGETDTALKDFSSLLNNKNELSRKKINLKNHLLYYQPNIAN